MDEQEYYDDLGGAYYFADDKESFEARTPDNGGCGCLTVSLFLLGFATLWSLFGF